MIKTTKTPKAVMLQSAVEKNLRIVALNNPAPTIHGTNLYSDTPRSEHARRDISPLFRYII
ncbi:hypothetical protein AKJ62_04180 [candidate division MSBL1 archaeon SCGC-AAA259D14]|uniref:Uncharacterized protein n=1 Tax=candidate division MSBL1 archaeon SCGC-AAA259D14 TaxID=1698261 RepID=A0A133U424_9EURY|nr:hypothetical protein AKJ62_04180 [candidate division MSBL1 archaeon SCGC-AAA259D14]